MLSTGKYNTEQKFGKLTILKYLGNRKYLCKCDCGKETIARSRDFTTGNKKSCGCLRTIKRENYRQEVKQMLINSIKISPMDCWEWQKAKHRQGYGHLRFMGKLTLAHRVSWTLFRGEVDRKIKILHKCDNPSCINPEHLFPGSQRDNIKDMFSKNRSKLQKLTQYEVEEIRLMNSKKVDRIEIAKKYNITLSNLCQILNEKTWKD